MTEPLAQGRYRVCRAPVFYINPQGQPSKDDVVLVHDVERGTFEFHVKSNNALKGWTFIITQANLVQCRDTGVVVNSLEGIV
jgi:hypothetical protein